MANSTLKLTFSQTQKTVAASGVVAVREPVTATVVGGWAHVASGLTLKLQEMNNHGQTTPFAIFPFATGDAWVQGTLSTAGVWTAGSGAGDLDAQCTLNLNTTELVDEFVDVPNMGFRPFNLLIYTVTGPTLEANGVLTVMNFPSSVTAAPTTISQAASLADLQARVAAIEAGYVKKADFAALDFTDLSTNALRNAALRNLLTILGG